MSLASVPMPILKMIFGFMLLVIIALLAGIIALGHVSQDTSYGLEFLLGALSAMAGGFVQWAFGETNSEKVAPPAGVNRTQS